MKKIYLIIVFLITVSYRLHAQGVIDFDSGKYYDRIGIPPISTYYEKGFYFYVVYPTGIVRENLGIWSAEKGANSPDNATAFLSFAQTRNSDDYVAFNQISGDAFGLISVQLSSLGNLSDIPVTFIGTKADGTTTVSQTFNVLAGSPWQTYYFDSDFSSGLHGVDIQTLFLRMDNLQFIPEPSTTVLVGFCLLAGWRMLRKRRCL